jgi:hypothetical protein
MQNQIINLKKGALLCISGNDQWQYKFNPQNISVTFKSVVPT